MVQPVTDWPTLKVTPDLWVAALAAPPPAATVPNAASPTAATAAANFPNLRMKSPF